MKIYYTIREIADFQGVAPSKVRFYADELNLLPYGKKDGVKKYKIDQKDKLITAITLADSVGMKVEGIKKAIKGGYAYSILKAYVE